MQRPRVTEASYDRPFQLWGYTVTHATLVLRSLDSSAQPPNVEVVFAAVAFVQLPTHLPVLRIHVADDEERAHVEAVTGRPLRRTNLETTAFMFGPSGDDGFVVAANMSIIENDWIFPHSSIVGHETIPGLALYEVDPAEAGIAEPGPAGGPDDG